MAKKRRIARQVRKGMLPGEYVKRSLITVPKGLEAMCLHPDGKDQDLHYVVTTRRQDSIYRVEVEFRGSRYLLPHRVVERIAQHIKVIQEQQRSDVARERFSVVKREDAQPKTA